MQYKITIPEPCRQSWDNMLPDETGRYCNSCQKSVVDFTAMADEEIQQYFIQHHNQPVCGRFKNNQLHRIVIDLPKNIFSIQMPLWMRFLVACLVIFGMSIFPFETTVAGKAPMITSYYQGEPIAVKTKKKHKGLKKKRKGRPKIYLSGSIYPDNIEWLPSTTVGYTVTSPDQPICKSIFDTMPGPNDGLNIAKIRSANSPTPEKKQPGPTPYMPTEFILPSILLFRRKNSSSPMD